MHPIIINDPLCLLNPRTRAVEGCQVMRWQAAAKIGLPLCMPNSGAPPAYISCNKMV